MDYYVPNDFIGWRYQQLARPEQDPIDYAQVQSLMFYYNGLPGKTTVACGIDDVKALRSLDARELVDPYVEVAGQRFTWQGRLAEGQYLTFWPASRCVATVHRWSSRKLDRRSPTVRHCPPENTQPASARPVVQPCRCASA